MSLTQSLSLPKGRMATTSNGLSGLGTDLVNRAVRLGGPDISREGKGLAPVERAADEILGRECSPRIAWPAIFSLSNGLHFRPERRG